ncbi:Phosphate acetyltransferase [hydrothermal vent metagenome]|uniref:Phosphate acetyltransferase n=1 Tax=hydrothermal vent metagenome TaxID=652676 RepID=A0A3B1E104_9ZZZZ
MKQKSFKNIFLSSIYQNAGKTTMSLGLYQAFKERKIKTTFMKPVGQQVVSVGDQHIDKDSYLMGKVFHTAKQFREMSPVTIGRGYTEKYIANPHKDKIQKAIQKSFENLARRKDAIIVEGTGHAGVGAVIDFSNADVAALLGSKVIMISGGGIGKSIDEIILNKALFDLRGVDMIGVIINKVLPKKYEKIKSVLKKGLKNKGIKLLGVIPYDPLLTAPTVEQVCDCLQLELVCGRGGVQQRVNNTIVAAMEPHNMIHYIKDGTLVITSGDRVDNILVAVSSHLVSNDGKSFRISGLILTGGLVPNPKITELLKKSKMPVMITEEDTYTVAARLENLICKIQKTDKDKIQEAACLVKKYVNIDAILKSFE